ncbi:uncharacterized protein RHOBADRAFT_52333 [Rhodotorula graminis WP1]|uniref:Uncharacterized protein n=1 Tax=Rhodotorula graminis (strain WP1) TaxID=578459 RepID=A0A194S6F0_RHOGW|nr:uncharacterized protein RHOBADRAFT_52333 [Rhodotorula graminis WP1]KPV76308.1 hypothetical protein RHOBADRAFT_52333 [Rhodotorula graminis WP1]
MAASTDELLPAYQGLLRAQSASLRGPEAAAPLSVDDALTSGAALRGKVVVVTGAASGFGKAYAIQVAKFGAKVVLSDLRLESVQAVVDEITAAGRQATCIACDVTSWDAQVAMFRHGRNTFGHLDVVAVNAGIGEPESAMFMDMRKGADGEPLRPTMPTLAVNLTGAAYTAKLAFFHLNENPNKEGKAVVLLGSMASFSGIPGAPAYSMSKHGILGLFRSLYYDALVYGIKINIVNPFFVSTGIIGVLPRLLIAGIPLATIDEVVAAMVAASTKPDSNGSAFVVDFKGILELPTAVFSVDDGYYRVFASRAQGLMGWGKWAFDVVSAVTGAFTRK